MLFRFLLLCTPARSGPDNDSAISYRQRLMLRDEAIEMHAHAHNSYMEHAFPHDELRPLTCGPRRWDQRERGTLDDILGGYLLTLVDGADTFAAMGLYGGFLTTVETITDSLSFDRDVTISTFEATIRVLGGLLSLQYLVTEPSLIARIRRQRDAEVRAQAAAAQAAMNATKTCRSSVAARGATECAAVAVPVAVAAGLEDASVLSASWRARFATERSSRETSSKLGADLLALALDLATRLLPAFDTPTGIPAHLVNLRTGVDWQRTSRSTCAAAAGTMLLEFGRVSRLTGDGRFEAAARKAVDALWSRRSKLDLVGATVHTHSGKWLEQHTGIGAGVDSFYEYLLKTAIYFDDDELRAASSIALDAAQRETAYRSPSDGLEWNAEVHKETGQYTSLRVSALQAFWPSLLVLAGDVPAARASFASFWSLWRRYRALPEIFDLQAEKPVSFAKDSPMRPELAESALHLFLATRDEHYLVVGRELIFALQNISRVPCGFASIADTTTHRLDDRMDSYFLSETLKYLFLLMDFSLDKQDRRSFFCKLATDPVADDDEFEACVDIDQIMLTTEGHFFGIPGPRIPRGAFAADLPPNTRATRPRKR